MIRTGCCLPGGSFMPQGEKDTPPDTGRVIIENTEFAVDTGYDYTEIGASFLDSLTDAEFSELKAEKNLRVEVANSFIPGSLSIFDEEKKTELKNYVDRVLHRASALHIDTMVFGSGKARNIPPELSADEGREVIKNFLRFCGQVCEKYGITVAIEPLNRSECNILNTVAECDKMVRELNLPHIKLIADAFHMWYEKEDMSVLGQVKDNMVHVHISEPPERLYPGRDGGKYLKKFAEKLKEINYSGRISAECKYYNFREEIKPAYIFMKENFYEPCV